MTGREVAGERATGEEGMEEEVTGEETVAAPVAVRAEAKEAA